MVIDPSAPLIAKNRENLAHSAKYRRISFRFLKKTWEIFYETEYFYFWPCVVIICPEKSNYNGPLTTSSVIFIKRTFPERPFKYIVACKWLVWYLDTLYIRTYLWTRPELGKNLRGVQNFQGGAYHDPQSAVTLQQPAADEIFEIFII